MIVGAHRNQRLWIPWKWSYSQNYCWELNAGRATQAFRGCACVLALSALPSLPSVTEGRLEQNELRFTHRTGGF